ncbi:MAG: SipW-dependent-type signal peptide-containing protein [Clostridiales bacterium]
MKKSIICAILAMSMILVGTGYAYWTDSLNVTTKATTGDLDVTFADLGLYAQYGNEYAESNGAAGGNWSIIDGIGAEGFIPANYFERGVSDYNSIAKPGSIDEYYEGAKGYNDVKFGAELIDAAGIPTTVGPYIQGQVMGSDNILITVENMYPGYAQAFRTDILNVGSIAAKLSSLNFQVKGIEGVEVNKTTRNMLGAAILIEGEYQSELGGSEGDKVFALAEMLNLDPSDIFTVGNVEFVRFSALHKVDAEALEPFNAVLTIPSENRMDLYIAVAMDPDAEGVYTTGSTEVMSKKDDSLSQKTGAQLSVNLLWDQFNAGVEVDSTNRLELQNN